MSAIVASVSLCYATELSSLLVVGTNKIPSLGKFNVYNIVLLSVIPVLYVRSLGIICLWGVSVCPWTSSLPPPAFGNHHCNVFQLSFWFCFAFSTYKGYYTIFDVYHLAWYPQGPSVLLKMAGFPFSSRLSSSPLLMYICFYSFIRWWTFWLFPHLLYCEL